MEPQNTRNGRPRSRPPLHRHRLDTQGGVGASESSHPPVRLTGSVRHVRIDRLAAGWLWGRSPAGGNGSPVAERGDRQPFNGNAFKGTRLGQGERRHSALIRSASIVPPATMDAKTYKEGTEYRKRARLRDGYLLSNGRHAKIDCTFTRERKPRHKCRRISGIEKGGRLDPENTEAIDPIGTETVRNPCLKLPSKIQSFANKSQR
jgi:hypothetical protein